MNSAIFVGMHFVRLVAVGILCLLPAPASALSQSWTEAYRAGDYEKAATLLHAIIADDEYVIRGEDPAPLRQLAVMYAGGLGVVRDPISACTLAQFAEMTTMHGAPRQFRGDVLAYETMLKEAERFKTEYCGGLSMDDLRAATPGCLALAMPEAVLTVGGHSVRVGRRGIHLADDRGDDTGLVNCPALIASVRPRSVAPPPDAAPGVEARQFIELFSWVAGRDPKGGVLNYALRWQVYEITAHGVGYVRDAHVLSLPTFPGTLAPADLESRVTLEMLRSGHIRWRIPGAPPRRGWIRRPQKDTQ